MNAKAVESLEDLTRSLADETAAKQRIETEVQRAC